jgi:hypothetical protein
VLYELLIAIHKLMNKNLFEWNTSTNVLMCKISMVVGQERRRDEVL